ncbi:oxidoreductase, short chain dehydrogenase/reductase family protein [Onchocerca flexuosa]|uniref:Oxidoreductase, short chain dehydrogenase/reductase family protein n=1 Tax=Onchocerca flexuosa TaxID=387005 RepID=A0A238C2B8_9BILA|nr:oxidoreductase, short chain dehydrogenase/reductase family protein [Onchocerca flexuosa]
MFDLFHSVLYWILKTYIIYRIIRTVIAFWSTVAIYLIAPLFYKPNFDPYKGRWTERKFDARVQTYLFDFYDGDYAEMRKFIENIDVGFVLNSVGVGRERMERYGDNPEADRRLLKVNGLGAAEFLSVVLPTMEKNGGGQIVVLSSSQGFRPFPYMASYCAAKVMLSFLCEAIDREWSTIKVQCLTPALVATKMTHYDNNYKSLFVKNADDFAREAVNTIGITSMTTGCFNHDLQMLVRHMFPWTLLKYILLPIYWYHKRRTDASQDIHSVTTDSKKVSFYLF